MLQGPALPQPYTILTWKWKLGQQQSSVWLEAGSVIPVASPLRDTLWGKETVPWKLSEEQDWRTLHLPPQRLLWSCCLYHFSLMLLCAEHLATAWKVQKPKVQKAKLSEATLLCSHHVKWESEESEAHATPSLSTPANCDQHTHIAFYLLDLNSCWFCPPPSPTTWNPQSPYTVLEDFQLPTQTKACPRGAAQQQQQQQQEDITTLQSELETFPLPHHWWAPCFSPFSCPCIPSQHAWL